MLSMNQHLLATILCLLSPFAAFAQDPPVKRMFAEGQGATTFDRSFFDEYLPERPSTPPLGIYLIVGDIALAFDTPRFRVDGAIMPTNMNLDIQAPFPTTQATLIKRVKSYPAVFRDLLEQIDLERKRHDPGASRETAVLPMATGTFTAQLKRPPLNATAHEQPFPTAVCFIATDYPYGGSFANRDLFTQSKVRLGIRDCLAALDKAGVSSVAMPLIGSASVATPTKSLLDPKQRQLLRCRLINSISGIALGIGDFALTRHSITEIGIVQWGDDIQRLFQPPKVSTDPVLQNRLKDEYVGYAQGATATLTRGLRGTLTTGEDFRERDCDAILGFSGNQGAPDSGG
jgi:hypothetical protein